MQASRATDIYFDDFPPLRPEHVRMLRAHGITPDNIAEPFLPRFTRGEIGDDHIWDIDPEGRELLLFDEFGDIVAWDWEGGRLGSRNGCFCLGNDVFLDPATFMLGGILNIFGDVMTWLHYRGDGIVVIDWTRAWDNLCHFPRIAVTPCLLDRYSAAMQPPRAPNLYILPLIERDAA